MRSRSNSLHEIYSTPTNKHRPFEIELVSVIFGSENLSNEFSHAKYLFGCKKVLTSNRICKRVRNYFRVEVCIKSRNHLWLRYVWHICGLRRFTGASSSAAGAMDSVSDFESGGCGFESRVAYSFLVFMLLIAMHYSSSSNVVLSATTNL